MTHLTFINVGVLLKQVPLQSGPDALLSKGRHRWVTHNKSRLTLRVDQQ